MICTACRCSSQGTVNTIEAHMAQTYAIRHMVAGRRRDGLGVVICVGRVNRPIISLSTHSPAGLTQSPKPISPAPYAPSIGR